jgi:hypothetical protein
MPPHQMSRPRSTHTPVRPGSSARPHGHVAGEPACLADEVVEGDALYGQGVEYLVAA